MQMQAAHRKRLLILAVACLSAAALAAFVWSQVTSFAATEIRHESSSRGLDLAFDDISVWPNGVVDLENVEVAGGGFEARFVEVSVDGRVFDAGFLSGRPTIARIDANGIRVRRSATTRSSSSNGGSPAPDPPDAVALLERLGGGTAPEVVLRDLELDLPGVTSKIAEVHVTGGEVVARGLTMSGARLDRFITRPLEFESVRIAPQTAVLRRDRSAIDEIEVRGVVVHTAVDRFRSSTADSLAGPATLPEDGWNARLHALVERAFFLGSGAAERASAQAPPHVRLTQSSVVLDDRELAVTELDASWDRSTARATVTGLVRMRDAEVGRLGVTFDSRASVVNLQAERFDLATLGRLRPSLPLAGHIDLRLGVKRHDDTYELTGLLVARDATVTSKRLADEPVVFADMTYEFDAVYAPTADDLGEPKLIHHPSGGERLPKSERTGMFEISKGIFKTNGVQADVTVALYGLGSLPVWPARLDVSVGLPRTPAQAVVDAIPPQLLGPIDGSKFAGELEATIAVELPLRRASRMRWKIAEQLHDFRITHMPEQVDVRRLLGAMEAPIGSGDPCRMTVQIPAMRSEQNPLGSRSESSPTKADGCAPWKYVPLDDISDAVHRGILTTEDGAFYRHTGFNEDAIRKSLERNIEEGRFVRGASTISMQFAKNMFLSKDKQAARKLREAILVYLAERVVKVPKKRVMEIYFNIIEYGVGVYGIWAAAQEYFGKKPSELEVAEVAWIITAIPGPRLRYPYFQRRTIPDEWWGRMQSFLDEMYRKERLDEYELLTAKVQPPVFRTSGPADNNPARFRARVAPIAERMIKLRETGMSREAVLDWSLAVSPSTPR